MGSAIKIIEDFSDSGSVSYPDEIDQSYLNDYWILYDRRYNDHFQVFEYRSGEINTRSHVVTALFSLNTPYNCKLLIIATKSFSVYDKVGGWGDPVGHVCCTDEYIVQVYLGKINASHVRMRKSIQAILKKIYFRCIESF